MSIKNVLIVVLAVALAITILGPEIVDVTADNLDINRQNAQQTDQLFADIYDRVSPSVVAISTDSGSGTGFVIDQQGHIVTNNHVVDDTTDIEVAFFEGPLARAQIVGLDPDSDLAVLRVNLPADQLQPVEFGDSDSLFIGQTVLAIGSPFGQRWTLTSGIISALDRTISGLTNFSIGGTIQTDASINPGNSGGPLLDLNGRVIGVNSQILSSSRTSSGVGFAIPSNLTRRVAQELISNGYVNYSFVGINGVDVDLDIIEGLGLPNNTRGVLISNVLQNSPASRAGLQEALIDRRGNVVQYDIITAVNNIPVMGWDTLVSYLAENTLPGETITLTILRNGQQTLQVPVQLTARPR